MGIETLTIKTRGRQEQCQPQAAGHSGGLSKNKRPSRCNFKGHPQTPLFWQQGGGAAVLAIDLSAAWV